MFKPSCIPSIVAVSLVIVAWAGAVQGQIIDFGGDYVSSDTALTSGVKFTSPNAGTDGVFTPYFLGGTTLTLKDNGTSESFVVTSGCAGADYSVVWDIPDTSGGGPF